MGCPSDDVVETEFHIRKSICRSDELSREYKFRNIPADAGFVISFPWENIRENVPEESLNAAEIQYWICTSVKDAELVMVERLDMSNLYMNNIIDTPLPQGQVGDNCWHQMTVEAIQFIRNNVFVSIFPTRNDSPEDFSVVEWLAGEIRNELNFISLAEKEFSFSKD